MIPNGRNTDGTLKNTEFSISSVLTRTFTTHNVSYGMLGINPSFSSYFGLSNNVSYDEQNNRVLEYGVEWAFCIIGCVSLSSGTVSYFNIKSPFRAVDYSEADFVISYQRPTSANSYTWYRKYKSGWVEQGGIWTGSISAGSGSDGHTTINLPVTMTDTSYCVNITNNSGAGTTTVWEMWNVESLTTNQFGIHMGAYANTRTITRMNWEVKGFAA